MESLFSLVLCLPVPVVLSIKLAGFVLHTYVAQTVDCGGGVQSSPVQSECTSNWTLLNMDGDLRMWRIQMRMEQQTGQLIRTIIISTDLLLFCFIMVAINYFILLPWWTLAVCWFYCISMQLIRWLHWPVILSSNGIGDDDDEGEIDLRTNWCGLISRLNSRNPIKWRIGFAIELGAHR